MKKFILDMKKNDYPRYERLTRPVVGQDPFDMDGEASGDLDGYQMSASDIAFQNDDVTIDNPLALDPAPKRKRCGKKSGASKEKCKPKRKEGTLSSMERDDVFELSESESEAEDFATSDYEARSDGALIEEPDIDMSIFEAEGKEEEGRRKRKPNRRFQQETYEHWWKM
jgi:hypothetical protein